MAETIQGNPESDDQIRQPKEETILRSDGVEFEAIERDGLQTVPVLSQAFDNQWFPQDLLKKAIKAGGVSLELERQREEVVRAEYIRSLINGEQLVINRAFIYNNEVINLDYLPAKNSTDPDKVRRAQDSREAFKRLLQNRSIVPFLLYEKSPIEPPKFSTRSFEEWKQVCEEVRMQCIRLSWDDEQNSKMRKQLLAGRFTNFAVTMATDQKDFDKYIEDLEEDPRDKEELRKHKKELKKQFRKVTRVALDLLDEKESVDREDLYKAFVVAEGTKPAERHYDRMKPFVAEIKQLLDLAYARNSSDAFDGYLLIPTDSPSRIALQETADELAANRADITIQEIMSILRRAVFDLVQRGLYLQSMDLLSLPDVCEIRRMNEWYDYMAALKALLKNPLSFAEGGAEAVQKSYARLVEQMTELIRDRYARDMEKSFARTALVIELIIEIGPALLSVVGVPNHDPVIQFTEVGLSKISTKTLPFAIRYVIRDIATKRASKGVSNSIELMRGNMKDAAQKWDALLRLIKDTKAFQEGQISPDKAPELTPPGA